jgi:lysophospholipase L1-like esterase
MALLGLGCGDSSSSGPGAEPPQTQREPSTPMVPSTPAQQDPSTSSGSSVPTPPPPAPATGSAGSGATGEAPQGPVDLATNPAQGPSTANGSPAPDAGAGQPADPPLQEPPPQQQPPAFAPCPTDGSACRIMPLGDSITFGIGSSGGGYRVELFRQALAAQRDITFVGVVAPGGQNGPNGPNTVNGQPFPRNHEGFSGFTISGGGAGSLAAQVDNAIAQTNPNIILLHIGTNDVNGNINVGQAPQRLGALLDQIINDAPNALLVVAEIIPTMNQQTNTRVQAYNAAIPALVQARAAAGKHIELLDLFTPFSSNPNFASLMNDNLHPNDSGYVVMGQTWFNAIEDVLPQP